MKERTNKFSKIMCTLCFHPIYKLFIYMIIILNLIVLSIDGYPPMNSDNRKVLSSIKNYEFKLFI